MGKSLNVQCLMQIKLLYCKTKIFNIELLSLSTIFHLQTDHEDQRRHNVELVQMQEKSFVRKEQARKDSEEQIQAKKRVTQQQKAEIEKETARTKEIAEAEKRILFTQLTEEQTRRELKEKLQGERDKWIASINATFSHIEGMPTDKNILWRNYFCLIYEDHIMCTGLSLLIILYY